LYVVTSIIDILNKRFGKETPITVSRGEKHDYLGMQLDYSQPGKVVVSMYKYIEDMLNELPPEMSGHAMTPAPENLFDVRPDGDRVLLSSELTEAFHHNTAKLLFLTQRACPDIQLPVSFFTTRVRSPDEDDYKKLARTMKYLRRMKDLPLTLEATNLLLAQWYVDGSYACHVDMKGHTGGAFTLGKGSIYNKSRKHKINTTSSTECEVVSAHDVLPQALWTNYFMKAQGYKTIETLMYQDNESAMRLEKNGRASSTKRTKHINVRYYFITDRIKQKELRVAYCPTEDMWADFHTKPLQGRKFIYFRNKIMNCSLDADIVDNVSAQECVGK